jgi:glycosyltransferase involved in cell wall biosynthesis
MRAKDKELLVFVLSRSGCLDYAKEMLTHLHGVKPITFTSTFALERMPEPYREIPTFRNKKELLVNSLYIPILLCAEILRARIRGCKNAWFPVFHPWNPFLLLFCKICGVRNIVSVHDGQLHPGENHPLWQAAENACFKLADHLVFLSNFVMQRTLRQVRLHAKAHLVPHGLIPIKELPGKKILKHPPSILFLGRLAYYKGIDLLLEAIRSLPEKSYSHLTIAGQLINPLPSHPGGSGKVNILCHRLDRQEMERLLYSHDILVLPYREASQSGILTMGISAAIPMVVCKVGGLPEQLASDEAIWVNPVASDIADGISKILESPSLWEEIHIKLHMKRKNTGWFDAAQKISALITD